MTVKKRDYNHDDGSTKLSDSARANSMFGVIFNSPSWRFVFARIMENKLDAIKYNPKTFSVRDRWSPFGTDWNSIRDPIFPTRDRKVALTFSTRNRASKNEMLCTRARKCVVTRLVRKETCVQDSRFESQRRRKTKMLATFLWTMVYSKGNESRRTKIPKETSIPLRFATGKSASTKSEKSHEFVSFVLRG